MMPITAKSVLFILSIKAIAFAAIAAQYDPMEEPVPYIFAAVFALAAFSMKARRAWWFALVVEVLTLAGSCASVVHQKSQGTSARNLLIASGVVALVALAGVVLMLRRSVRDWYKSRQSDALAPVEP